MLAVQAERQAVWAHNRGLSGAAMHVVGTRPQTRACKTLVLRAELLSTWHTHPRDNRHPEKLLYSTSWLLPRERLHNVGSRHPRHVYKLEAWVTEMHV